MAVEKRHEIASVDHQQFTGLDRRYRGSSLGPAEQRNLSEHLAGSQDAENHIVAVNRRRQRFELAVDDDKNLSPIVSLVKQLFFAFQLLGLCVLPLTLLAFRLIA